MKSDFYKYLSVTGIMLIMVAAETLAAPSVKSGKLIVEKNCAGCHVAGVMGAPKIGDKADWSKRAEQGVKLLISHSLNGFNNMPAKGGNSALSVTDVVNAVAYLLDVSGVKADLSKIKVKSAKTVAKNKTADAQKSKAGTPATTTKSIKVAKAKKVNKKTNVNKFNRLMKSKSEWNPPPAEDGIHDPDNEGTYALQTPKESFADMASNPFGNHIDWVKALNKNQIEPRFDRLDPNKKPFVLDLNIVREVKGSMPDVVYPHKQHTEWLDCSNCHPAIFIPKKGANQISMASILMGEKCGVCHGKVAFPVSECRRCHSKNKTKK